MDYGNKTQYFNLKNIKSIPQLQSLSKRELFEMRVVARVLPFRVNNYVLDELIDWDNTPEDPIFQLTFPQKEMLDSYHFDNLSQAILNEKSDSEIAAIVNQIRYELNPHPDDQLTANVPHLNGTRVSGVQHKYRETVLVFPAPGQTCHSYCTFCFRWAQFVKLNDIKFATDSAKRFHAYIKKHKEVTDILFTGGDPMTMNAKKLRIYIEPLLGKGFEHVRSIRIGTKSISYWPQKYLNEPDTGAILTLFEEIVKAGKHLAIMAHVNHWREISTQKAKNAISNILSTGAKIRTQSPILKHINDDADVWARMWQSQVELGMIPYYMFIERDTSSHNYFALPLAEANNIFRNAYSKVSGLARTVRGPSMSSTPGKIEISGITEINNEKVFVLNFIQARNSDWVKRPFFAKFNSKATWLNHLEPAFGDSEFFYEDELNQMLASNVNLTIKTAN